MGNGKVPSSWGPELQDIQIWAISSDLDVRRLGPAVARRLGVFARVLAREMPVNLLSEGGTAGGVQMNGLDMLIRGFRKRFESLNFEQAVKAMVEYLGFKRGHNEAIDQALVRWEVLKVRAAESGTFAVSPSGRALLLLMSLRISRRN